MFRSLYNEVTQPSVQQQPLPLSFNIYNDMKLQMQQQQQQVNAILPNVSPVSVPVDKHDNTNTMQPINPVVDAVSSSSGGVSAGSSGLYSDNRYTMLDHRMYHQIQFLRRKKG
jgi:hypothetical protein